MLKTESCPPSNLNLNCDKNIFPNKPIALKLSIKDMVGTHLIVLLQVRNAVMI